MIEGRLSKNQKDPNDYKVTRCEVLIQGELDKHPCGAPFAIYVHDGVRMCAWHDYEWRHRQ